jgi:hypothetical protein
MISRCIPYVAAMCLALAVPVSASPILEIEPNHTLATSQFIPGSAFTLPVPAVSVAGTLLLAEATLTEVRKKDRSSGAPAEEL